MALSGSVDAGMHNEYKSEGVGAESAHANNCISHARRVTIFRIIAQLKSSCEREIVYKLLQVYSRIPE